MAGEEVVQVFPEDGVYDTALPQDWTDKVRELMGPQVRLIGHIVWHYPNVGSGHIGGLPYPVTEHGKAILGELAIVAAWRATR